MSSRPAGASFALGLSLLLGLLWFWSTTAAWGQVMITASEVDGADVFRIETETATYVFDKQAAALIQVLDRDGHDWVGFRPEGTPGLTDGDQGWYRGIPNLGSHEFGHTRTFGTVSTTPDLLGVPLAKATIESSRDDWHATWEFFADYAKMTLHRAPENYWLLYEGTPGGHLDSDDVCWRADGQSASCDEPWIGDIVNTSGAAEGAEWVFFADGTLDRSLFMAHPDDARIDSYFRKGSMTVFGFGRRRHHRVERWINQIRFGQPYRPQMRRASEVLILGFVESRDFDTVKQEIDRLYHPQPVVEDLYPHDLPMVLDMKELVAPRQFH